MHWRDVPGSKVNARQFASILKELAYIKRQQSFARVSGALLTAGR